MYQTGLEIEEDALNFEPGNFELYVRRAAGPNKHCARTERYVSTFKIFFQNSKIMFKSFTIRFD